MLYKDSSLFKKGKKLATGTGVNSMMDKSYKRNYTRENTILEVKDPSDLDSRWNIYERQRIQDGKPASYYHQTTIAKDIKRVKERRS